MTTELPEFQMKPVQRADFSDQEIVFEPPQAIDR